MKVNTLMHLAVFASLVTLAGHVSADVIYKCGRGTKVVYQDAPCKPGTYRDNVLTTRNAKGSVTFIPPESTTQSGAGSRHSLEAPRLSDQDLLALEEKQRLLNKPPIKDQLAAPTAIESRIQVVWNSMKQWFTRAFQ